MWYISINNRLWFKFSTNRCDVFYQRKNESGQEVQIQKCHWEKRNFCCLLISQSIQLLAWIALGQFLAKFFTFSRKNDSLFYVSMFYKISNKTLCLWTVRPLERHRLSALHRLHLAAFTSSVIHGADGRAATVRVTSGACRSRTFLSDAFNSSNSSQSGHSASDEATWEASVWNLVRSIRRRFRDVTCCFARPGFLRERLQKTVLWSDSAVSTTSRLSMMTETSRTITQSRVWPQRWAGWPTSCCRQQSFSNDFNLILHCHASCLICS